MKSSSARYQLPSAIKQLANLPRSGRQLLMLMLDIVALASLSWLALYLALNEPSPVKMGDGIWLCLLAPALSIPIFVRVGLYRAVVRYIGTRIIQTAVNAVTLATIAITLLGIFLIADTIPNTTYFIYWSLAVLYMTLSRLYLRNWYLVFMGTSEDCRRIIVYGAGHAGMQLATSLQTSRLYRPVAFVDDSEKLHGHIVQDLVVRSPADLPQLVERTEADLILLALPSVTHQRRQNIIKELEHLPIEVKTVPSLTDLMSGKRQITDVRELDIEDLLGRDSVDPIPELMESCITGKVVMVTGAGGSIGAELCRQILLQKPSNLILFEKSEYALYEIEKELLIRSHKLKQKINVVPILGSIEHRRRIEVVCKNYGVQTIYHAAACKHVPLVERNPIEGVRNNIFGTYFTALAAQTTGVETFILISTDKAVRTTNVMGATKRFAELILQGMAKQDGSTTFTMVRFGNVLGSSGSVVPLFQDQIKQGGPITVTHPEITRYFMTIREAAELVIQAGSMAEGGEVFVLDMGQPIKIVDLATRLIRLNGLNVKDEKHPSGDIEIVYTGLRPGEKLYEELLIGENVSGTVHSRIMRAEEDELDWQTVKDYLDILDWSCHDFSPAQILNVLTRAVAGYRPQGDVWDISCPEEKEEEDAEESVAAYELSHLYHQNNTVQ